jgi:putative peptidoglycan lipid II flippase
VNEHRHIARTAGVVGALTLCSRITGLLRDSLVGYVFGSGMAADAFFVAFRIPNLLRRFVAEGAMNVAFIPVFSDYLTTRSREEAVEVARVLATTMAVVLAVLTALGILLAPISVWVFAPGFSADADKAELTIRLTRLLFPYIFLVSLSALLGGLLNALRHFVAPAFAPVLLNLSMIGATLVLCPLFTTPIYGLAFGVLLGGVLQLWVQRAPLRRLGVVLRALWQPNHPVVRRVLLLMAPTVFGAAVYQINVMMSTVFASVLPAGSVSYLWYADRVFEFPLGLFAVALGTATLPSFSAQAARRAFGEMRAALTFAIGLTNFITVPAAVGCWLLALPITVVLFQRGAFGPHEAEMTAWALRAFAVGLWSVSIVRVIVPAFYALQDTRTPVLTATAAFLTNMLFSLLLIGPVESDGSSHVTAVIARLTATIGLWDMRHAGLALATSLAATVNLVLLALLLARRLGGLDLSPILASLWRSAAAAAVMAPVVHLVAGTLDWHAPQPIMPKVAVLLAAMGAGMAVFGGVRFLLGGPEVDGMRRIVSERLARLRRTAR